jgi:hypothetical protein
LATQLFKASALAYPTGEASREVPSAFLSAITPGANRVGELHKSPTNTDFIAAQPLAIRFKFNQN